MPYQYYGQFYVDTALESALTNLISEKEGTDYVCKVVSITIPEHIVEVYSDESGISGAEIAYRNEHYGQLHGVAVPAEEKLYVTVMNGEAYQEFQKLSYNDPEDIQKYLSKLSDVLVPYAGILNPAVFYRRFPYLKDFFDRLDEWRAQTGRVTLDDDILADATNEVLTLEKSDAGKSMR